jgi:carbonic anhydrase/acetyltransferase-like protein (isoleucine patch superfamily)
VPIYAIGEREPTIAPSAFIHPDAVIIGDVTIGPESSVWPGAVLRGDSNSITVGAQTSIQDGAIVHCTRDEPTSIGNGVVVGHLAHLEGCIVEDGALLGSGSVVLPRAHIGVGALVAAGAVVPNDVRIPAGALARGVPARIMEGAAPAAVIADSVDTYVHNAAWYNAELRRLS